MEVGFWKSFVFLLLPFTFTGVSSGDLNRSGVQKDILSDILINKKFDMYVRPEKKINETEEPLEVFVSLYILNIDVDMKHKECSVQMYFRQEWNDTRLSYSAIGKLGVLSYHDSVGIWTPDLFFVNEKHGHLHTLTKPNIFMRIFPEGRLLYSERVTVKFACQMDLRKYPFDKQLCAVPIESYGYTASDLQLKWKPDTTYGIAAIPGYQISYSTSEYIIEMAVNKYSRIELGIHLTRLIYPVLLHVYIPLGLLVVASWLSFCLRYSDYIPRLATTVTITTITTIFVQSLKEFTPPECYLTALDIWIGFCCFLVFSAFFETVYVISSHGRGAVISQPDGTRNKKDVPELPNDGKKEKNKLSGILSGMLPLKHSNVDDISRIMFPSVFVLFNVIYISYYLI